MPLSTQETESLREAVQLAMEHSDACAAVREIYQKLQIEIDRRKPICVASGKCCHFEAYGHRLYVTTLELATFKLDMEVSRPVSELSGAEQSGSSGYLGDRLGGSAKLRVLSEKDGCPLQQGTLCSVHAIRPFGCRIFFCDPTATDWQHEQYELFHRKLKELHERQKIPYFYIEWRQALGAVSLP